MKTYLPGQHIEGSRFSHDHFPDRSQSVSESRVKELVQLLKEYQKALQDESDPKHSHSAYLKRAAIIGGTAAMGLSMAVAPVAFGQSVSALATSDALKQPFPFGLLLSAMSGLGAGSFFFSGYFKKREEIRVRKALFDYDNDIKNYELIHVLHAKHGLEPKYTSSQLILLDKAVTTATGEPTTLRAFAPAYIPEFYTHKLPDHFRVKSADGSRLLHPKDPEWPSCQVRSTFWKYSYEGDFQLTIGERYLDDGRWSFLPEIKRMQPAGLYTTKINFGASGTGKSQSGILPDVFQFLAWNAGIDSESQSADKIQAYSEELAAQGFDANSPLNPFGKLSEEAFDSITVNGKNYAWEKIAMFLVEPKGELYADVQEILDLVGRPNDFVSLGTDAAQVALWRERRQELRFAAHRLYALWDQETAWHDLQKCLTAHLSEFWKAEIIKRFQTGDFQSLNPKEWQFQGTGVAFLLSDFQDEKKCPPVDFRGARIETLQAILKALQEVTQELTERLFPASGFGIVEGRSENLFLGFVYDKPGVRRALTAGGLLTGDAGADPYRRALQEAMALLAAGVGDLSVEDDQHAHLSTCDGLFRGVRVDAPSQGLFPCLRPISVLGCTPPPPLAPDAKPDILNLVASDLSAQPPVELDETRLRQKIRFMAPAVRRPGEKYKEWVFRKRAAKLYAHHRHHGFATQFHRLKEALTTIPQPGHDLKTAYSALLELLDIDCRKPLDDIAGDLAAERRKGANGLSRWQHRLRGHGYSPVAARANGAFERDIRVGLAPIDAAWHIGCWKELAEAVQQVCAALVEDFCRKALATGEQPGNAASRLRLALNQAFELMGSYVEASHRYYAIMVPPALGFAIHHINDPRALETTLQETLRHLERSSPKVAERLKGFGLAFSQQGHLPNELVGLLKVEGLTTRLTCSGGNAYNPIYNPEASPQAVANELGAALTGGEVKGEQFWSDAYTEMAAYFISICMAAEGWVTITDVLTCFMSRAFYERKLMVAEHRLAMLKDLASKYTNGSVMVEGGDASPWGQKDLPVCLLAERDWALAQIREMSGMRTAPGAWLGKAMDHGEGLAMTGPIAPCRGGIPLAALRALESQAGGGLDKALTTGKATLTEDVVTFPSYACMLAFLQAGRFQVPSQASPVLDLLTGLYLGELQTTMAGNDKRGVSRTQVDAFLVGRLSFALCTDWQLLPQDKADPSTVVHTFCLQPPLTPPPVLAQEVQALETAIQNFKHFVATTLQGEALGDPKTRANVLISFQVKVSALKSDAAIYSFSPGSRFDITFPTFQEMRDKGLVIVSRITDSVYLGIDQLITRMAIQQFQRVIRSRVGRYKALMWAPKGELTQLQRANKETSTLTTRLLARFHARSQTSPPAHTTSQPLEGPKGQLLAYIAGLETRPVERFPSPLETEKFRLCGNLFPSTAAEAGLAQEGRLAPGAEASIGLELLAMAGALHVARGRQDATGDAIDIASGAWAFLSKRWSFEDDLVIRGLAMMAVHGEELQRLLELSAKGRLGEPVRSWLQGVFRDNLGSIRGDVRFAEQKRQTTAHQVQREASVACVQERRALMENFTTVMDEPDLRRLVAYVCDEVQQYVIPAAGKVQGDGSFYEVARAGMVFCDLATQTPSSLKSTLGEGFNRYIGNILTWVVLKIPVKEDAELVASMLGTEERTTSLQVDGTLQAASSTTGGMRGTSDDLSVKWDSKGERKQRVHYTELMELESMQAYTMVTDGQRRYVYKIYTTPYFIIAGQKVNPYGPKGLMLQAESQLQENPERVLSHREAMNIVNDHGWPWVEEPVVKLIQHRAMDMSKSRTSREIESDARLHAMRVAMRLNDEL